MSRSAEFDSGQSEDPDLQQLQRWASKRMPSRREEPKRPEQRYDDRGLPVMFHGTKHEIGPIVLPSHAMPDRYTQWKSFYQQPEENWRSSRVFASQHEGSAWRWAQGPGRPRVHEVDVQDPRMVPGSGGEWHGEHAMVKTTHWAPPPARDTPGHVEATLPPIDWEKFGGANWRESSGYGPNAFQAAALDHPHPLQPKQFAGQGKLF